MEEWLKERKNGIGGSDVAAMLGASPWKTPHQLWLEKTGREEPSVSDAEAVYWGTVLEDVIADRYVGLTGRKVQRVRRILRIDGTIALANIDRAVVNPEIAGRVTVINGHKLTTDRILEVKTAHALASRSSDWGEPGTDEVPMHYWLQCKWYLGITGARWCDLAVLFGGQKLAIYTLERDDELFARLLDEAEWWWHAHVVADMPPEPTTVEDARRLWARHEPGKTVAATDDVAAIVTELADLKEQLKAIQEQIDQRELKIMQAMGDAEALEHQGKTLVTWKQTKPRLVTDWRAVAEEIGAPEEVVARHTVEREGARVFRIKTGA